MKRVSLPYLTCLSLHLFSVWALQSQEERSFVPIDLTGQYTRTIASMPSHEFWAEAPDGEIELQGTPFHCRGILELTGISGTPVMER